MYQLFASAGGHFAPDFRRETTIGEAPNGRRAKNQNMYFDFPNTFPLLVAGCSIDSMDGHEVTPTQERHEFLDVQAGANGSENQQDADVEFFEFAVVLFKSILSVLLIFAAGVCVKFESAMSDVP